MGKLLLLIIGAISMEIAYQIVHVRRHCTVSSRCGVVIGVFGVVEVGRETGRAWQRASFKW